MNTDIVHRSLAIALAAASAGVTVLGSAQSDSERLQFQVASVKRNTATDALSQLVPQRSGRLVARAATLKGLIGFAYELRDFQLTGGPEWLDRDRWDIDAANEPATEVNADIRDSTWMKPFRLRLQSLLVDRFRLRVHTESRGMPLFELRVAKSGSRLAPSTNDVGTRAAPRGSISMMIGGGEIVGVAMPVSALVGTLSTVLKRVVTDRTGLQGLFDFKLTWAPDVDSNLTPRGPLPPGIELPPVDPTKPSLFTAVQEQLGLRLDSVRGQVPVLVIDGALPATPD